MLQIKAVVVTIEFVNSLRLRRKAEPQALRAAAGVRKT